MKPRPARESTTARHRGTLRIIAAASAVVPLLLVGCGGSEPGSGSRSSSTRDDLSVALQFAPKAGFATETDDASVLSKLGAVETLVTVGGDGLPAPGLATAWRQLEPRTWRFELREGVFFHNGEPLTAPAVAQTLTHVATVATPARAVRGLGLTARADGPAVLVSTKEPDPILPLRLTSPSTVILAPAAYAQPGVPSVQGTGTGPFRITEVQPQQSVSVERFDGYWGQKAALRSAVFRFVPDPAARAAAVQAGDVDIAEGVPITSASTLEDAQGLRVEKYALPRSVTLHANVERGPLAQRPVREALMAAVDRRILAEQVLEGAAAPATEVFGPAVPWTDEPAPPPPDPARAKALLQQAGVEPGTLTLRLWTYPARAELPDLATAIKSMLEEAGIRTDLQVAEYNTLEPRVLAGDYDLFLSSRSSLTDIPDASSFLTSDYTCTGSYNLAGYCSPEFDQLARRLPSTEAPQERHRIFREAADKLAADRASVPIVHSQGLLALREDIRGLSPDPLERHLLTSATSWAAS